MSVFDGSRLPPGGSPISLDALRRVGSDSTPEPLTERLSARLEGRPVSLCASGRDAMRHVFRFLADETGRNEVILPAYCCYSLPASAVAAGLRVRAVDVDECGRIDLQSLASLPLENVCGVVVGNLFGLPDPIAPIESRLAESQVRIIDDAAQSLGAVGTEGAVGTRGGFGVLSFGRAKPLSALGGGAIVWPSNGGAGVLEASGPDASRAACLSRAVAYDVARHPVVFRILSAIPSLGIGETHYDPAFRRGEIDGASRAIAQALLPDLDRANADRRRRAESVAGHVRAETGFEPLTALPGTQGIYPRLALRSPNVAVRSAALEGLRGFGATAMYPAPMTEIAALRPHWVGASDFPGATTFSDRLLTLPCHAGLTPRRIDRVVQVLREIAPA